MNTERSEQELVRREKLARLQAAGYPYPNDTAVNSVAAEVHATIDEQEALDLTARKFATTLDTLRQLRLQNSPLG